LAALLLGGVAIFAQDQIEFPHDEPENPAAPAATAAAPTKQRSKSGPPQSRGGKTKQISKRKPR
jgi:hypothetical protein